MVTFSRAKLQTTIQWKRGAALSESIAVFDSEKYYDWLRSNGFPRSDYFYDYVIYSSRISSRTKQIILPAGDISGDEDETGIVDTNMGIIVPMGSDIAEFGSLIYEKISSTQSSGEELSEVGAVLRTLAWYLVFLLSRSTTSQKDAGISTIDEVMSILRKTPEGSAILDDIDFDRNIFEQAAMEKPFKVSEYWHDWG